MAEEQKAVKVENWSRGWTGSKELHEKSRPGSKNYRFWSEFLRIDGPSFNGPDELSPLSRALEHGELFSGSPMLRSTCEPEATLDKDGWMT